MTDSKKWTLKTSKEDETNPGPIYKTNYYRSIAHANDRLENKPNSSFGINRDERYETIYKGMEKYYLSRHSPGPGTYSMQKNSMGEVPQLSNSKIAQRYSMPKVSLLRF